MNQTDTTYQITGHIEDGVYYPDHCVPTIRAIDFLRGYPYLPPSVMTVPYKRPSNSELRRWLNEGAVVINGKTPQPTDMVEFPIKELVFFSKGKRKTTVV